MKAIEMIKKYDIALEGDDMLRARIRPQSAEEIEMLKAAKIEVMAILKAQKEAEENAKKEAAARLAANVPGLEELRQARWDWSAYHDAMNAYISSGRCTGGPSKPISDPQALAEKYPVAAAYLKAESYENASHYAKSAAGRKAKERIINGEDYKAAIEQMESEWTAAAQEGLWN